MIPIPFDATEQRLLNEFQRGFPLVPRPYAEIAAALGTSETWVREGLDARIADGTVSRVGAVFAPGAVGASTLAALAVPPARLADVAARVSAQHEVNHNYEREHRFNLWFVATAPDAAALAAALAAIARDTGLVPIALPLVREYWIDLGFDLTGMATARAPAQTVAAARKGAPGASRPQDAFGKRLAAALERGLSRSPRPFAALARIAGGSEDRAIAQLRAWCDDGTIKRFGVVLRHRPLGYLANAMCVWDVPDGEVDGLGAALATEPDVTLCYRRERASSWPYNLFAMLHGRDRATVEARRDALAAKLRLDVHPHAVLFSRRAFKQRGARYFAAAGEEAAA